MVVHGVLLPSEGAVRSNLLHEKMVVTVTVQARAACCLCEAALHGHAVLCRALGMHRWCRSHATPSRRAVT
jgi:hypothetical protein